MNLHFFFNRDRNRNGEAFGLFFVHSFANRHLVRFFASLGNADGEVDRTGLFFGNRLADGNLTRAVFGAAELNLVFVLLRFRNLLADLNGA